MLFEQNVASIWQLETRKTEIFEQKTGISVEIFWFEIEIEPDLNLGRVKNTLIWVWRKRINFQLACILMVVLSKADGKLIRLPC